MKAVLTTVGKFHTFDLARQLYKRDMLAAIYTGYPMFKLRDEGLPEGLIRSFPYFQTVYMARERIGLKNPRFAHFLAYLAHYTLDGYAARTLPPCDVFVGLSGCGLIAGARAKEKGALVVCDRGSTHIRYQERALREEFRRHGREVAPSNPLVDPRRIRGEEREYAQADLITVPSTFVRRSFIEMGIPAGKVRCVPYGVDLSRFAPAGQPDPERFDVLFVGAASLRKGIPYLLEAFERLRHPRKTLTLVGTVQEEVRALIARRVAAGEPIVCTGHCPQARLKEVMSRHHVLVLASVEEGLALVQAQAMACGCPVIATAATGSEDLFTDGREGGIVAPRDAAALAERLQRLADFPEERARLGAAALRRVQTLGGWDNYGRTYINLLQEMRGISRREAAPATNNARARLQGGPVQ